MNEHEKRGQTEIATLELLQALKEVTRAHEDLMTGNFDRAREDIKKLIEHAQNAGLYIPEESGE